MRMIGTHRRKSWQQLAVLKISALIFDLLLSDYHNCTAAVVWCNKWAVFVKTENWTSGFAELTIAWSLGHNLTGWPCWKYEGTSCNSQPSLQCGCMLNISWKREALGIVSNSLTTTNKLPCLKTMNFQSTNHHIKYLVQDWKIDREREHT